MVGVLVVMIKARKGATVLSQAKKTKCKQGNKIILEYWRNIDVVTKANQKSGKKTKHKGTNKENEAI